MTSCFIIKRMKIIHTCLGLALFIFSSLVLAAEWTINKDHSEVMFQVSYLTVSELTGRFNEFSGYLVLDDKSKPQSLAVKIQTASIDTGNKMRDGHLRGNDFFESSQWPQILFKSESITQVKPSIY